MIAFLFPTKAEASIFTGRLSRIQRPETRRQGSLLVKEFWIKGERVLVIVSGMGKEIARAADAFTAERGDDIVLAGLAKSLNKDLRIGDVVGIASVRKENESGAIPVTQKLFPDIPYVSLVTCDRFVFRCADAADLADMEGFYAVLKFTNLSIVKAVSDCEEDIEFLNDYLADGRIQIGRILRHIKTKQWMTLIKFYRNARLANKRLAEFLVDFLISRSTKT